MTIYFVLVVGAGYQTSTPGTWEAANKFGTSNQVNLGDAVNNYIRFAGLTLNKGSVNIALKPRPHSQEVLLVRRYIEYVTTISEIRSSYFDANRIDFRITYRTPKRVAPAPILIGTANTDYKVLTLGGGVQTGFTFTPVTVNEYEFIMRCIKTAHGLTDAYFTIAAPGAIYTYAGY